MKSHSKFLWLLLVSAIVLAHAAPARAVDPKAERELANVQAGVTGTVAQFNVVGLAASTESADLIAAPSVGSHLQIIWLDWLPTSTINTVFTVADTIGGTVLWAGKTGTSGSNTVNNHKPELFINLRSNSPFRIKNADITNAIDIRLMVRYVTVND